MNGNEVQKAGVYICMYVYIYIYIYIFLFSPPISAVINNPAANEGDTVSIPGLGQEDPLELGVAARFGILAWKIPWTEELGGLQYMGSQRAGHN